MHFIDWLIFGIPLLIVLCVSVFTRRYMKSVADFMSGGRVAGRYLLAVAKGELAAGAAVFAAQFEIISNTGFTWIWWQWLYVPVLLAVAISGFVVYRYRETRAMTMAQFFELRYNKSFRLTTGALAFFAGLLNFGIIPAVGARIFVYFLGLPAEFAIAGIVIPTFVALMALFLAITLCVTLAGGFITVMITDCIEGMLSQVLYLVIIVGLLLMFTWDDISAVLASRPPGHSMLNPFDSNQLKDFNIGYVLMALFVAVYGTMAWQNSSAYNSAAITPHESRMATVLGMWREMGKMAVIVLLAVCALTFLSAPDFASRSVAAHETIDGISSGQIQKQMAIPVALSHMLPILVKGAFCAILLMGILGGDSTHLHSWGGIFVQDVLVPLRKKPFGPRQHILALRLSICGVALFAFCFGALFTQTEYISMWWSVTMAIYVGGVGAAIIGGLYWKKGTSAGAWSALSAGSTLSVGGILARQIYGADFPLNGMQISFIATLSAIAVYVVVSLLTTRGDFNLDRMLHRGEYASIKAVVGEAGGGDSVAKSRTGWGRYLGFDEHFTTGDKWLAGGLLGWTFCWFLVMAGGTLWNLADPWPIGWWSSFWHVAGIGIPIGMAFVTAVWFTWGGIRDIFRLFYRLSQQKVNHLDDGSVVDHRNLDEIGIEQGCSRPVETVAEGRLR